MSLYLVHRPIIFWINFCVYGRVSWPNGIKQDVRMPIWCVPIHIALSLLASGFLTICVEEPARNFLKEKLQRRWAATDECKLLSKGSCLAYSKK